MNEGKGRVCRLIAHGLLLVACGTIVSGFQSARSESTVMKTVAGPCPKCGTMVEATTVLDEGSWDGFGPDGKPSFGTFLGKRCPRCESILQARRTGGHTWPGKVRWQVLGDKGDSNTPSQGMPRPAWQP